MRTIAILGVLLSQAISVCGPGSVVVCVHQGGRSHIELASATCCHQESRARACGQHACADHKAHAEAAQHAHASKLDHEHRLVGGAAASADRCCDESGIARTIRSLSANCVRIINAEFHSPWHYRKA